MHTATLNLTLSRANDDMRSVVRYAELPGWVVRILVTIAWRLIASNVQHKAEKLSMSVLRVIELIRYVESLDDQAGDLIDPKGTKAELFMSMLEDAKHVHTQSLELILVSEATKHAKLMDSARQLAEVAAEYHERLVRLCWAVAEHDASRTKRLDGFVGSTPEEIEDILACIADGE